MNKIYKWCIMACAATTLSTSCSDFLEEDNKSGLTADTFYKTKSGAEALVNSCYTPLRFWYGQEYAISMTELGTDIFTRGNGCGQAELSDYNSSLQGSSTAITKEWERLYSALNTCNSAINRLPTSDLQANEKDIRLGEAHFLRALYLWHIVETWGGVYLTTDECKSPSGYVTRSSVEDFYKTINEDLKEAFSKLPETTTDYGRATKGAAEALMARVCLYTGDNEGALTHAKNVINNYGYELAGDYNELCDINTCNESKENIFVCVYDKNEIFGTSIEEGPDGNAIIWRKPGNNPVHLFWVMCYDQVLDKNGKKPVTRSIEYGRGFNRYMPTAYYLDLFNEKIDSRYDDIFQQAWICNNNNSSYIAKGDTAIVFTKYRMSQEEQDKHNYIVIDRDKVYNADGSIKNRVQNVTFKKFLDPTRESVNYTGSKRHGVILRLAEMYLIAAEAELNMNHKKEGTEYINQIRRRAGKEGHKAEMEISQDELTLDFILDERARELGGEQQRWYDLKRTGKLLERVQKYNPDAKANIKDYHILRPIPQTQLDAVINKEEFKQNTGYSGN